MAARELRRLHRPGVDEPFPDALRKETPIAAQWAAGDRRLLGTWGSRGGRCASATSSPAAWRQASSWMSSPRKLRTLPPIFVARGVLESARAVSGMKTRWVLDGIKHSTAARESALEELRRLELRGATEDLEGAGRGRKPSGQVRADWQRPRRLTSAPWRC